MALVAGLDLRIITENCPAELALRILDAELDRLFGPALPSFPSDPDALRPDPP